MESKNELEEIDIKNGVCYYFYDIITNRDIFSVDILLDEKIYENISVYDISYKTSSGPKPFNMRFDKIDAFIIILHDSGLFDKICDKIKYLISEKSGITDKSKLIHVIVYLSKKYRLFIM